MLNQWLRYGGIGGFLLHKRLLQAIRIRDSVKLESCIIIIFHN